jgi:hypothetical protein
MTTAAPVVFCIFNRPQETLRVWEAIRSARPRRLYIVSDGPRPEVPGEADRVAACRAIAESADWPCSVEFDYADRNLGCGARIATGLDRVFSREERAVILEDDTVPAASFFRYCEELLERYADCPEILHINGRNNLVSWNTRNSYFFARRLNPWGWATWRRAWRHFALDIKPLSPEEFELLIDALNDREHAEFIRYTANKYAGRNIDTWDIQWSLSVLKRKGLCIVPRTNLVENIGFGTGATHTRNNADDMRAAVPAASRKDDLEHPASVQYHSEGRDFDRFYFLFEQLNTYSEPGVMIALNRLLSRTPCPEEIFGHGKLRELLPFLGPARHPDQTRELLRHLEPHLIGNRTLDSLLRYFS